MSDPLPPLTKEELDTGIAFRDLPAGCFPFTVEYYETGTDRLLHTTEVTGPGSMRVPGKKELGVDDVHVVCTWPDGLVTTSDE